MEKKNFSAKKSISLLTPIAILLLCTIVSLTLAFFFSSDWTAKYVQMSGKVDIEAVGKGNAFNSIEDTVSSCNLEIEIDRDYGVLIPNMPITVYANCKVKQSTTKPLLRAKLYVSILDDDGNPFDDVDHDVASDMYNLLETNILDGTNWAKYEGYYYYLETPTTTATSTSVLQEIDATAGDVVVNFLEKPITVPYYIDSNYSGLTVKIIVTFQAIQNYIANKTTGERLTPNTIANSQVIFDDFTDTSNAENE